MIALLLVEVNDEEQRIFLANLYETYKGIMAQTAYKYVNDISLAEDMVHDSLVNLFPHISKLMKMNRYALASYVVHTVRNTCINYNRRKSSERKYLCFENLDGMISNLRTDERHTEEVFDNFEQIKNFRAILCELPEKDQEILIRKYIMQEHDEEIAKHIGCKSSSVRMLRTRARHRAIEVFRERGYFNEFA